MICTNCGYDKEATKKYFYPDKTRNSGWKAWCKLCSKRNSRKNNPVKSNREKEARYKRAKRIMRRLYLMHREIFNEIIEHIGDEE